MWETANAPKAVTLNTHFKENGYHTASLGKIFHNTEDNAHGWTDKPWKPKAETYALKTNAGGGRKRNGSNRGAPYEAADVADDLYADGEAFTRESAGNRDRR